MNTDLEMQAAVRAASDIGHLAGLDDVLREVPLSRLHAVPSREIDRGLLLDLVQDWILEGRAEEAARLLEGLFAEPRQIDRRDEALFVTLCDALARLQQHDRTLRLYTMYEGHPDIKLASVALQREVADRLSLQEYSRARECFHKAQRLTPDDPYLAALEVALLQQEGDAEQARRCAARWIARFRQVGAGESDFPLEAYIAQLQSMLSEPHQSESRPRAFDRET